MRNGRLFAATCKHCGRHLLTAALFTDAEIDAIRDHLAPCARLSKALPLGEVLTHLRVTTVAQ